MRLHPILPSRSPGKSLWHQARVTAAVASTVVIVACGDSAVAPGTAPVVDRITLATDAIAATSLGEVIRILATPVDRNGRPVPYVALTWSSSDLAVLVSEGDGMFRTVRNGSATVRVSIANSPRVPAVTAQVNVLQRASRILLSVDTLRMYAIGQHIAVRARVVDDVGTEVANVVPTWRSTDPRIATVDSTGTVTAKQDGDMTIAVFAESLATSLTARVKSAMRFTTCATSGNVSGESCRTLLLSAQAKP